MSFFPTSGLREYSKSKSDKASLLTLPLPPPAQDARILKF